MQKPQETTKIVKGEQVELSDLKANHDNVVVAAPGPGGQGVEGRHALRPELGIFPILVFGVGYICKHLTVFRHGHSICQCSPARSHLFFVSS